jgi:hypothetical protein
VSGYDVVAIEHDRATAQRLRQTVAKFDLPVHVHHGDAIAAPVRDDLAFVCVTNLLHHLGRRDGRALLARLRAGTLPGGLHVITVFTDGTPTQRVRSPFRPGELRALYAGWDILAYREWTTRPLRFGGDVPISFPYAALIARRPRAAAARRRSAAGKRTRGTSKGLRRVRKKRGP